MKRRGGKAPYLVGAALLGAVAIAAAGHLVDGASHDDMRLETRIAAVPDAAIRATLTTVGLIGQGMSCGLGDERLSHALFASTATIKALSSGDEPVQSLSDDVLAAGITRQREGRGTPCADVDAALKATEQAFAKRGLL